MITSHYLWQIRSTNNVPNSYFLMTFPCNKKKEEHIRRSDVLLHPAVTGIWFPHVGPCSIDDDAGLASSNCQMNKLAASPYNVMFPPPDLFVISHYTQTGIYFFLLDLDEIVRTMGVWGHTWKKYFSRLVWRNLTGLHRAWPQPHSTPLGWAGHQLQSRTCPPTSVHPSLMLLWPNGSKWEYSQTNTGYIAV